MKCFLFYTNINWETTLHILTPHLTAPTTHGPNEESFLMEYVSCFTIILFSCIYTGRCVDLKFPWWYLPVSQQNSESWYRYGFHGDIYLYLNRTLRAGTDTISMVIFTCISTELWAGTDTISMVIFTCISTELWAGTDTISMVIFTCISTELWAGTDTVSMVIFTCISTELWELVLIRFPWWYLPVSQQNSVSWYGYGFHGDIYLYLNRTLWAGTDTVSMVIFTCISTELWELVRIRFPWWPSGLKRALRLFRGIALPALSVNILKRTK